MPSIEAILANLTKARSGLLRAADSIPADHWKKAPRPGAWSAGEIVAHLIMVESKVIANAEKIAQKEPKFFPLLKRLHLPLTLVGVRVVRRKTPIPLDPALVREKEEMLAALRSVREKTLAFMGATKQRNLSAYRWKHAFLGSLNMYEWFQMLASHEIRHTKQIREIAAHLPKGVATLQDKIFLPRR